MVFNAEYEIMCARVREGKADGDCRMIGFEDKGKAKVGKKWKSRYKCQGLPWWSSDKESTFQCRGSVFDP